MKTKKIWCIALSAFLAAVLLFGGGLLLLSAVRQSRAVAYYKSIRMEEGVCSYFASYYKGQYLTYLRRSGTAASDTPEFWAREDSEGVSYATRLSQGFSAYLKELLVTAALYDSAATLSSAERTALSESAREMLDFRAEGSEKKFNELTAKYGFTYDDYEKAITILYKSSKAQSAIYGASYEKAPYICDLDGYVKKNYKRVYLLVLRTETRFVLDENGNRVTEDGRDQITDLTQKEREERAALVATVRAQIENRQNGLDGEDGMMTAGAFYSYIQKYDDADGRTYTDGYYFSEGSSYTAELAEAYPALVEKALSLSEGEYAEYRDGELVIFLAAAEMSGTPYTASINAPFFTDLYARAAKASFAETVALFLPDAVLKEAASGFDIVGIPYNSEIVYNG